jgi:hypothetical protein
MPLLKTPPEVLELDDLLTRLNWTGADLQRHVKRDKNTVTNWRRGHTQIPYELMLYLRLLVKFVEMRV